MMIREILNESYAGMLEGQVGAALTLLHAGLDEARRRTSDHEWRSLIESVCLSHPVTAMIHQDPFTATAFAATGAGYTDQRSLDCIYYGALRCGSGADTVSLGRRIFGYTTNTAVARALRCQRRYVASVIDGVADAVACPRVLTIEPGRLREAELSFALANGALADLVAFGNDQPTLDQIARTYGRDGVRTVYGSPLAISRGDQSLADYGLRHFDLVYSSNFFNQLSTEAGQRLALSMWQALRPGGQLLISCVLAEAKDLAFLECYAGWQLVPRTRTEVADLIRTIPIAEIHGLTLDTDPDRAIAFLVLRK